MTLPVQVVVRAPVQWPVRTVGAGFVSITKVSGVWRVEVNYRLLAALELIPDPTTKDLVVRDRQTNQYNTVTISQIAAAAASIVSTSGLTGAILNTYRIVTAAGDATVNATTDEILLINKSVGAATNVNLPASSARNGVPIWIKDLKGDAATNNITCVLNGTETIDGFDQAAANANGKSKIDINGGFKALYPFTSGGYYTLG